MNRIAIIIPYIGRLRSDFGFWLKSVEYNPTIDFILITDCILTDIPKNMRVIPATFSSLNKRFADHFDFELSINVPYKYCDLKPSYGEVFADLLAGYDFWGHTDMDMVYGDLRKFITKDILNSYDRIFGFGHLSLYRNTPTINAIYRQVQQPNYRQVFSFSEGCAFDEYYGVSRYWDENMHDRFYQAYPFDDIDCTLGHFEANMRRKELSNLSDFIYSFENGALYRVSLNGDNIEKDEIMYVHFQKRDMSISTAPSDKFMMVPNRYISYIDHINPKILHSLAKGPRIYPRKYRLMFDRVRNKYRKIFVAESLNDFGKPKLPNSIKYYVE